MYIFVDFHQLVHKRFQIFYPEHIFYLKFKKKKRLTELTTLMTETQTESVYTHLTRHFTRHLYVLLPFISRHHFSLAARIYCRIFYHDIELKYVLKCLQHWQSFYTHVPKSIFQENGFVAGLVEFFFANLYICSIFYNTSSNAWKIYLLQIRQIAMFMKKQFAV